MKWQLTVLEWLQMFAAYKIAGIYLCRALAVPAVLLLFWLARLTADIKIKIYSVAIGLIFYFLPNILSLYQ